MKLSPLEKLTFRREVLEKYAPMTIITKSGEGKKFWVLKEHLQEYVEGSFESANGEIQGPCNVPLSSGLDQFVLTDMKYQELLTAVSNIGADPTQMINNSLDKLEERLDGQDLDNEEITPTQRKNRERIRRLKQLIKPTVSVTELINSDYISREGILFSTAPMIAQLAQAPDPLIALQNLEKVVSLQAAAAGII